MLFICKPLAYSVKGFAAKEAFGILNDQIQICNHRFDMARAACSSGITTVSKSAISTDSPAKHSVTSVAVPPYAVVTNSDRKFSQLVKSSRKSLKLDN